MTRSFFGDMVQSQGYFILESQRFLTPPQNIKDVFFLAAKPPEKTHLLKKALVRSAGKWTAGKSWAILAKMQTPEQGEWKGQGDTGFPSIFPVHISTIYAKKDLHVREL